MSDELHIQNDDNPLSKYRKLLDLIPVGAKNAISMKTLSNLLNIDERSVRELVKDARIAGNIICGTGEGYFIPDTMQDLVFYYYMKKKGILTASHEIRAVEKKLREEQAIEEYFESIFPD